MGMGSLLIVIHATEVDPPARAIHTNGIDILLFAETAHRDRKEVFVIVEEDGVAAESVVVDGLEVGEFGKEEAQLFQVEHFLNSLFGDTADGEFVDGGGEGVIDECRTAEAIVAADKGAQSETVEVEWMQTVLVVT